MNISIIHITGASGSGTSTLGKFIAQNLNYRFFDGDDYFWQPTNPPFTAKRSKGARIDLLRNDAEQAGRAVISGCICNWGEPLIPWFELVVRLETATDIRLARLKNREFANFGDRIKPGGDMYHSHMDFMDYAASYDTAKTGRNRALHDKWLKMMPCPVLTLDGTLPPETNFETIREKLLEQELKLGALDLFKPLKSDY